MERHTDCRGESWRSRCRDLFIRNPYGTKRGGSYDLSIYSYSVRLSDAMDTVLKGGGKGALSENGNVLLA